MVFKLEKYIKYIKHQVEAFLPNETKLLNKNREFVLIIASAHKVGSTWVYKMIRDLNLFHEYPVPRKYRSNQRNMGLLDLYSNGVDEFLLRIKGFRLYKSHSIPPVWGSDHKVKFLSVFRDPRDIVISNIFYLANLDSELGGWPELSNMTLKERIKLYLNKGGFDLELLDKWYSVDDSVKVRYEDLLVDTDAEMKRIFSEMGLNVSEKKRKCIVNNNAFKKLSVGRGAGQEDSKSFFRKGISGDWKNHFSDEEKKLFKYHDNGKWNDLLIKLGYEVDDQW